MSTTETFISRDPPWNDGNAADLQRYHLYLNLIQNVDRNVAFLTQKVFSFDSFSELFLISKKCANHLCRKTTNEKNSLKKNQFKGTVVNREVPPLHKESLEIRVTDSHFQMQISAF